MSRRYGYYGWYAPTKPKEVKGGVKARSKRGSFASNWWGKRWIQTLESFRIGARLSRGRSYARKGQVADLHVHKGGVSAKVQGARSGAYRVLIKFETFNYKQWRQISERLLEQPIFAAQLLGNQMPEEIESVFEKEGLKLFPDRRKDLETDCSCPDWSNPCKHIAAVLYLMAEAFDEDPFLLFKLRGMERNQFLKTLRVDADREALQKPSEFDPEPLPLGQAEFWGETDAHDADQKTPETVKLHAALPKRLGSLPFWRSDKNFISEMETVYQKTSAAAEAFSYLNLKRDAKG